MRNRARKRNLYSAVAVLLFVAGSVGLMAGAEARQPTGTVVPTVAGDLVQTNRAPYDPAVDVFLGYHERSFDRAYEFDRAMLEGLGAVELDIDYKDWHGPIVFSGPRLSDVLRAAGCAGGPVTTLALDGFATEISSATLAAHEWVLATRADGRPPMR